MTSIDDYVEFRKPLLPIEKMKTLCEDPDVYRNATPFPHMIFDEFFDPAILERVLEEFPGENDIDWRKFADAKNEIKLASRNEQQIGLFTRYLIYSMNSSAFLNFLETLTGISGLLPDPHLWGGGLHQILRGGKLGVHTDFNKYTHMKLDRRLNVLVYLNRDWQEDWGGHLELWNRDMSSCVRKVSPMFNRIVCFNTTDYSFHGHPDPLGCPPDRSRRSLALYYYSNGRPADEVSGFHDTAFKSRPSDSIDWHKELSPRQIVKKLVPPIVLDLRRMIKGEPGHKPPKTF